MNILPFCFSEYILVDLFQATGETAMMTKDQQWIHEHLNELSEDHPGAFVAVANQELFIGESLKDARQPALKKYPNVNPSMLEVPRPEVVVCAV
jgi:hypothetical protein